MLYAHAVDQGFDINVDNDADIANFIDADQISSWAYTAMQWAYHAGLMGGKGGGIMDPRGQATRAEAAVIIRAFCENVAK